MTKTLATLIKIHQHALDEQRRVVVELETVQARLIEGLAQLQAEMAAEKLVAQTDVHASTLWPSYISGALRREQDFHKQIAQFEQKIMAARAELQRRFADVKKYEIAKDNADAVIEAEALRQERMDMDEIAGQRAARDDV